MPRLDPSTWTLRLFGLVKNEIALDYFRFQALPRVKVYSDIHCVTGWSRLDNHWEGVATTVLQELVQLDAEAGFVLVHAPGGFTTNLSLEEFFAEDVLLADRHGGRPLTPEHGFPVRLVVPRLYFWKSAKWVTGIEFLAQDQPGFWERAGYHNHGDPWKEERYR